MPTYIMISTLTAEGVQTVKNNPNRIKEVNRELEQIGARVLAPVGDLGRFDFVNVVEAPDEKTMAKVSLELGSRGTAHYESLPAIPIDEFIDAIWIGSCWRTPCAADPVTWRTPSPPSPESPPRPSATGIPAGRRPCRARTASGRSAPDCMVYTPVGIKCPECARQPRSAIVRMRPESRRAARSWRRSASERDGRGDRDPAGRRPLLRAHPRLADRDRDGRGRARRRSGRYRAPGHRPDRRGRLRLGVRSFPYLLYYGADFGDGREERRPGAGSLIGVGDRLLRRVQPDAMRGAGGGQRRPRARASCGRCAGARARPS